MKKGFTPVVISALLACGALVGCGPTNPDTPPIVNTYTVTITNKEEIEGGQWTVGGTTSPSLKLAVNPAGNVKQLINNGTITITSANTNVVQVNGTEITPVGEGTTTITVTCGTSQDTVTITVLSWIDPITEKPVRVTEAKAGTYKMGSEHYGFAQPGMWYFKDANDWTNSYYWTAVDDFAKAGKVVVEEIAEATDDYKWTLKSGDKYLGLATSSNSNGDHVNQTAYDNATDPKTHWKWDATLEAFVVNMVKPNDEFSKQEGDYYLGMSGGTNKSYNLLHVSTYSEEKVHDATGTYPAHLYVIPQELVVSNTTITLVNGVRESEKIDAQMPQGTLTFTKKSGDDCVTIGEDGTLTAASNGTCVITVSDTKTSIDVTVTVRDPLPGETVNNPMTPAQAIQACSALDGTKNETSAEKYYVKGVIVDKPTADYCNFNFSDGTTNILSYGLWNADGSKRYGTKRDIAELPVSQGDTVELYCNLQNYGGKLEMTNARLIKVEQNLQANVTVVAEHATVNFTEGVNDGVATKGTTVKFTVSVDDGYELVKVSANGVDLTDESGVYSVEVTGNVEITVVTKEVGSETKPGLTADNPMTSAQALEETNKLGDNETTDDFFYVKGDVTDTPTANFCNFHMGEFYVYGLNTIDDASKAYGTSKEVAEIPFYEGDEVLIKTQFQKYVNKSGAVTPEGKNAQLISFTHKEVSVTTSSDEHSTINMVSGVTSDKALNGSTVTFTVSFDEGYEAESVKVNNVEVKPEGGLYSFVVKGPTEVKSTSKVSGGEVATGGNITLSIEGGTKASAATVNEKDAIKCGTGSVAGVMLMTVPAEASSISFYIAGWKGKNVTVKVTGLAEDVDLTLTSDDGITNNSPFTLVGEEATFLKTISFGSPLATDTVLTFTATKDYRFVIWGATWSK